ncbi:polysaccharide deacetylase family protein [Dermabacteraceae bacterium P7006]
MSSPGPTNHAAHAAPSRRTLLAGAGGVAVGALGGIGGYSAWRGHARNLQDAPPRSEDDPRALSAQVIFRRAGGKKLIALTFDDGPDPRWTPTVRDTLNRHGARATFFQMGNALQTPEGLALASALAGDGHELAIHADTHENLATLSYAEVTRQVEVTARASQEASGKIPRLWRPPYGALSATVAKVAADRGLQLILWSHHITGADPEWMRERLLASANGGEIVLLHDGRGDPNRELMDSLGRLVGKLQQDGWEMLTVSELLARTPAANKTPKR